MSEYSYDEEGNYFPFFVLTFLGLVLVPLTYTSLFRKKVERPAQVNCNCDACVRKKSALAKQDSRIKFGKRFFALAAGWALFAWMAYRVANQKFESKHWDPYEILGISASATEKEIKKHYKKLSLKFHPDKIRETANETLTDIESKFIEISKAYQSLTDEEVRKNFLEYGHPDGKQEFGMGIALPLWIVESQNNLWVLGAYGAIVGLGLPFIVGKWWYGSKNKTTEGVENDTAAMFFKGMKETVGVQESLQLITKSKEYAEEFGQNAEVSGKLEKALAQAGVTLPKDDPNAAKKALALIEAHLNRLPLENGEERDKQKALLPLLRLHASLSSIGVAFNYLKFAVELPRLGQNLIQAVPLGGSPLLQLPGITTEVATKLRAKGIWTVQDLMAVEKDERKTLLIDAGVDASVYKLTEKVARSIPVPEVVKAYFKVPGDNEVTPGALVNFVIKARIIHPGVTPPKLPENAFSEEEDAEDDVDALIGRKTKAEEEELAKSPMIHAPYWPRNKTPKWSIFLGNTKMERIFVHPTNVTDLSTTLRTFRVQFPAPPQPGNYQFTMFLVSDSYIGTDVTKEVELKVVPVEELGDQAKVVEDTIEDTEDEDEESEEGGESSSEYDSSSDEE
ncbi:DnaJ-domain-containing protein [Saitoella complicata NRRL Y-17804]|nr:DnaJ-domain-containing protein [Saitoella complicata NRRL Y-17804]ODQ55384.1 DnaJ-domain-containing protein [Saitoella complicata NRRL Y-17804]